MRVNSTFRLAVTILAFAIGLFFLFNRRDQINKASDKQHHKTGEESGSKKVSNTDYIFFESLSRYLFVSLQ